MNVNKREAHLSGETLARLVDNGPSAGERDHLERCDRCSRELELLVGLTRGLAETPSISPIAGEWQVLERRLEREGLVGGLVGSKVHGRVGSGVRTGGRVRFTVQGWARVGLGAAAGLVLFFGGAMSAPLLFGDGFRSVSQSSEGMSDPEATIAQLMTDDVSLDEAEELVRLTQDLYFDALLVYRERVDRAGPISFERDPMGRFIALENVLAATEAAVREAPADPFLNGLLVSTTAEHRAAMEGMTFTATGIW